MDTTESLVVAAYDELKRLAHEKLRYERDGHTLNTTALVHEAYLKLSQQTRVTWRSRTHFLAVASQAMRRVLVDYARQRGATKRGGGEPPLRLELLAADQPAAAPDRGDAVDLLALDDALDRLAQFNDRGARVVEYRFFGGLSHQEIAELLGISEISARRVWTMAKAWLRRELAASRTA